MGWDALQAAFQKELDERAPSVGRRLPFDPENPPVEEAPGRAAPSAVDCRDHIAGNRTVRTGIVPDVEPRGRPWP